MAIRLTPEAKTYLERMLKEELKYIRLSLTPASPSGRMSYMITWTNKIVPDDVARTARDWNVIVIERKYAHLLGHVLLGLDVNDSTKVVILENPDVLTFSGGKIAPLNE